MPTAQEQTDSVSSFLAIISSVKPPTQTLSIFSDILPTTLTPTQVTTMDSLLEDQESLNFGCRPITQGTPKLAISTLWRSLRQMS